MKITNLVIIFISLNIYTEEVNDPFEELNRKTYEFNEKLDSKILKPTAQAYSKLPPPVKKGVTNFFNNLEEVDTCVNQLLQGKPKKSANDLTRFLINSTVGLGGFIDVASKMGLERHEEDFGQTLATWGIGDGFYIVLPLFGPSNLRDTSGMILTMMSDPINAYAVSEGQSWIVPMRTAVNAVDQRSKIIDEVNALRDNSVDYYAAVRSSYYQNRNAAISNEDDSELTPLPLISIEFE